MYLILYSENMWWVIFHRLSSYAIRRIEAEASLLKEKLDGMESSGEPVGDGYEKASKEATIATIEVNYVFRFLTTWNFTTISQCKL